MIPDAILNQIQDRIDIVEVISKHVLLKRAGRSFKANCPFHNEKTPSFIVNPDKQIFHCFGCGAGGNVFTFIMKAEKRDFLEVVESLAETVGIEIPKDRAVNKEAEARLALYAKANDLALEFYHNALLTKKESEKARAYLGRRGIRGETIEEFKLGFAPEAWDEFYKSVKGRIADPALEKLGLVLQRKDGGYYDRFRNRVIFPILDAKGICIGFGGRVLDDSVPKYLNSSESEFYQKGRHLYGLFHARKAIRETDAVIIVEGYMDVIGCHQAGVRNVVASLGTALTMDQVRMIKRHTKNVVMLYDADRAGELATLRGLELFLEEDLEIKIVRLSSGHDPDDFIKEYGAGRFKEEVAKAKTLFEYRLALLKAQSDPATLEGKVKIAREMVSLLSRVNNEILKNAWIKELAGELALSEEALLSEMRKNPARLKNIETRAPVLATQAEVSTAEKLLIGLFLESAEFVAEARETIGPEDFISERSRAIVAKIFEEAGRGLSAGQFMNFYKEDADSARILSQACAEADAVVDKKRTLTDCLAWLRKSRLALERENLKSEIIAAERQGDKNRISRLLFDFNKLNQGMKKIDEEK